MALIDLKSDLSWYGKTAPHGVYLDDRNNTKFTYNDDLTVTAAVTGNAGQNLTPKTSANEFNASNGVSKRKTQLGVGTQLPIGPTGGLFNFDIKRIGWHADSKYGSVFNRLADIGLAKTYINNSPLKDMYNKFKVHDEIYDAFGYAKTVILRGIQKDDRTDPQRWGLNSPTMDVPRDGVVSTAERIANDAARLGKFLIRPTGLLFLAKQQLLHLMQPNPEQVTGDVGVIDPIKLFNPVNFLASALGSPLGLRFKNWGLQPLISLSPTYESTKKAQNIILDTTPPLPVSGLGTNRLLNLHFQRIGNFVNPLGLVEWLASSAATGPDSVAGIGRTSFTKRQEYNTFRYPSGIGEIESIPIGDVLDWSNTYARQNKIIDLPLPSDVYNIGAHLVKPIYNAKQLEGSSKDVDVNFYVKLKKNQRIGFMRASADGDKRELSTRKMMINRVSDDNFVMITTPEEGTSTELFPLTGLRAQFDWHDANGDTTDWYGRNIKASPTTLSFLGPESGKNQAAIYLGTRTNGKNTGEYISDDDNNDGGIVSFNPGKRLSDGDKAIAEKLADTVKVDDKMKGKFFGGVKELVEKKFDRATTSEPATILDYRSMSYPQIRKTTKNRTIGDSKVLDFRTLKDGAAAEWDTDKKPTLESFYGYTSYNAANRTKAKPDPVQNAGFGTGTDNDKIKDLIKFEFEGLGGTQHGKRYMFRAYINSLDDTFSPGWSGQQDQGRADQKYLYASYERQINVDFKVVVHSHKEMGTVWDKLSELAQNTLPVYPGGGFHGQFIRVTIGDLYVRQYMFINSLSYSWDNETPWEITEGMQLPLYTDVSLGLTHVGAKKPASGQNPFQYERATKLSDPFGNKFTYTKANGVSATETRDTAKSATYDATENKAEVISKETPEETTETKAAGGE